MIYAANEARQCNWKNGQAMWASKTNYSKLYSAEYVGNSDGIDGYDGSDFERCFFEFCASSNISALLEVGSARGRLQQAAQATGMQVFSSDFHPAEETLHFDLLQDDLSHADAIQFRVNELLGSLDYVTTCLDVMEHIDIEDVGSALFNLHRVVKSFAIVSISTRPSSRGNKYHSTILPIATWRHLFEIVGFEIVDANFCAEGRRLAPLNSLNPDLGMISHWAQADIFRDRACGEPTYLLLRKSKHVSDKDLASRQIENVLDVAYRREKRLGFDSTRLQSIAFNISHFQDFLNLRPILDVVSRGECSAFLRLGALMPDEEQLVIGFFERCGVPVLVYRRVAEIDWRILNLRTLISAAESSAAINHVLSTQLVEAANLNGVNTILLQHGIWIQPMQDHQIRFASNTILTWGKEHERFFANGQHSVAGRPSHYGSTDGLNWRSGGSPKFHDSLLVPNNDILKWRLGIDTFRFDEAVLLGTNLKWAAHGNSVADISAGIERMITSNPDKLFVIKPHPSERNFEYANFKFDNTIVLDDILMGCIDLSISRLLGGISTVVSSLSTLLLDGAVLDRRCIQYDTGNKFAYKNCKPFSAVDLALAIQNRSVASLVGPEFASHYNDSGNKAFYEVLADCVSHPPGSIGSAGRYTDLKSAEDMWLAFGASRSQIGALELERASLASEVQRAKSVKNQVKRQSDIFEEQVKRLSSELEIERQALSSIANSLASIQGSTSWRLTSPYRWVGFQLRRVLHVIRVLPRITKSRGNI